MRIFVSSSFDDLKEHRVAAIRVLRQLGHEVIAMEDMTAGSAPPLDKVIEMVDRSEAYVGIFAWRYGSLPEIATDPPPVKDAVPGKTSITHYEYLRAVERNLPIMAFLIDERWPWPPQFVDGFDQTRADPQPNTEQIRKLRLSLQRQRVVSWFTTPADLEARVSAAVTTAGLSSQINLQAAAALSPDIGSATDSGASTGVKDAVIEACYRQQALKIDLSTEWWSTRLYLIASLAERLTQARRILVVDSTPTERIGAQVPAPADSQPSPPPPPEERFIGQVSTSSALCVIGKKTSQLKTFQDKLGARSLVYDDLSVEIDQILQLWFDAFGDTPYAHAQEQSSRTILNPEILRRWFGELMLTQPIRIADLQRASAIDILRLLDYPNDFVPVVTRPANAKAGSPARNVGLVDKTALNASLARSYLVELLDRARIDSSGAPPTRTW